MDKEKQELIAAARELQRQCNDIKTQADIVLFSLLDDDEPGITEELCVRYADESDCSISDLKVAFHGFYDKLCCYGRLEKL